METLPSAFSGWATLQQFVLYKIVPSTVRAGKMDKLPIDYRTGKLLNAQDVTAWTSFNVIANAVRQYGVGYGVGFVFTEQDPYFFLDIDNCLLPDETWSKLATDLCTVFAGCAVEVSSSGKGLHLFGRTAPLTHGCKNIELNLELYTAGRFVALTGLNASGSVDTDHTAAVKWLADNYFPTNRATIGGWTHEPVPEWNGPSDDIALLDRMLKSHSAKSVFGQGAAFADLWEAKQDVLAKVYPDTFGQRPYDASSADAALAQHLAFWTGNNCERMQQLMLQSKLVREKWNREDYLQRTILNACATKHEWLKDKAPQVLQTATGQSKGLPVTGATLLSLTQQVEMFAGCIYVQDEHKILTPGGNMLKPDQFRATYGGYSYLMDLHNERVSRNAWECFTESQAIRFPRAASTCFRPTLEPGAIIESEGRVLVNLWWPIVTARKQGDITPFLNHLKKILPNERDQLIFLSYIAGCVQYPGIKFQWCPILQGVEGNGKTLFTRCVAFAVGDKYSHFPKASEICEKYNDWMYRCLFVGIEDIYTPDSRNEVMEIMKPMITSERLEIRAMYTGKVMRDICCNFLINTNHKDGLRKTRNDRRFAPFYTAQQSKDDMVRDGLTPEYFTKLYRWLSLEDGYAIVAEFLANYAIPAEFNPANRSPAPITSSTEEAIEAGLGYIEQEIQERIAQGVPGFKDGWISSTGLERLLQELHASRMIPLNKRQQLLQALGYVMHPGLPNGRVNRVVIPDGNKPRLFIRVGHPAAGILDARQVTEEYIQSQLKEY